MTEFVEQFHHMLTTYCWARGVRLACVTQRHAERLSRLFDLNHDKAHSECRQLRIAGAAIPNSSGVSFYRINVNSRISYIREAPEHFVKLTSFALPTLSVLSPLLSAAQPFIENLPPEATAQPLALLKGISQGAGHSISSWLHSTTAPKSRLQPPKKYSPPAPPSLTGAATRTLASLAATRDATTAKNTSSKVQVSTKELRTTTITAAQGSERASAGADTEEPVALRPIGHLATTGGVSASVSDVAQWAGTLAGTWHKLKGRSDVNAYGRALELMGIKGLQKTTAMLIDGMETHHTEEDFEVFYLTIVPYFKVRESYKFDSEVKQGRRDLRRGQQTAIARQKDHVVEVDVRWGPPHAGGAHEKYWLDADGLLHVESTVTVDDKRETTLQVGCTQYFGAFLFMLHDMWYD
jgi:hypothetical protein